MNETKQDTSFLAGELVYVARGEYSGYGVLGVCRVLRTFDYGAAYKAFKNTAEYKAWKKWWGAYREYGIRTIYEIERGYNEPPKTGHRECPDLLTYLISEGFLAEVPSRRLWLNDEDDED